MPVSRVGLSMFRISSGNARLTLSFVDGGVVTKHEWGNGAVVNRVAVSMSRRDVIELALWIKDNVQAQDDV